MSKLSFRARALDASKPMPIFMAEELPDLPDYSAINRAVPQMPSGMEKEEECEHHLQRAIVTGLIIPTPEVTDITDKDVYEKLYPANYKQPRQLIHMQPFAMEQDIIDYDMDSEDERWLMSQTQRLELSPLKFEEMMDKLEKSSGQTVVTLNEAKALLKEDDDLIIAVYDYWLNKRLKTQHTLIPQVKTEHRAGIALNNPYLAFRRRTEKMQTRKNRKNDESSYEKMLKLRRDLVRAVTLLELVKRREKAKREYVHLTIEVFEKRYQAKDFSGAVLAELASLKASRPAFTPIFQNHYSNQNWAASKNILKDEDIPRKEKRQYRKRKHKQSNHHRIGMGTSGLDGLVGMSSDEEAANPVSSETEDVEDEGQFTFRRNKLCSYHMPKKELGNWSWCSKEENGTEDKRFRFTLTSLSNNRCIGFARRRLGRGGRVVLDRVRTNMDDFWRNVDFSVFERKSSNLNVPLTNCAQSDEVNVKNELCADANEDTVKNEPCADANEDTVTLQQRTSSTNNKNNFGIASSSLIRGNICNNYVSSSTSSGGVGVVKEEPVDFDEWSLPSETCNNNRITANKDEQDEMMEFLKEIRRDWLHFRPKTPPPDYEPPCYLLPAENDTFLPSANVPFALELQPLDTPSSVLTDTSSFVTTPFVIDDFFAEVPITDTRQRTSTATTKVVDGNDNDGDVTNSVVNLNVNVGLSSLDVGDDDKVVAAAAATVSAAAATTTTFDYSFAENDARKIGCSTFNVVESCQEDVDRRKCSDLRREQRAENVKYSKQSRLSSPMTTTTTTITTTTTTLTSTTRTHSFLLSTLTSPNKANNVHSPLDKSRIVTDHATTTTTTTSVGGNTNGLLAQFNLNASTSDKMKINKLQPYAYIGGEGSSTSPNQLSVRTSTHTHNTLNSHSANVLEIPLSNETDKLNSQFGDSNPKSANNKNKSIVQKNNFVMEVT